MDRRKPVWDQYNEYLTSRAWLQPASAPPAESGAPTQLVFRLKLVFALLLCALAVFAYSQAVSGIAYDQIPDRWGVEQQFAVIARMLHGDGAASFRDVSSNFAYYGILVTAPAYALELASRNTNIADPSYVFTLALHFASFICFLVTNFFVYAILRSLRVAERDAFAGTIVFALYPMWLGHSFFNHKDVPTAAFFVMAAFAALKIVGKSSKAAGYGPVALLVFSTALLGGLKIAAAGLVIPAWTGVAAVLILRRQYLLLSGAMAATVALIYAITPMAWLEPVAFVQSAVGEMVKHSWNFCTRTNGFCTYPHSDEWSAAFYLASWFLVQTPILILLGLVAFIGQSLFRPERKRIFLTLMMMWPVFFVIVRNSVVYDALRHFLFVFPLIFIAAITMWSEILSKISRLAFPIGASAISALFVLDNVALFPYNYSYFNLVARQYADETQFDTDYWGLSLYEAVRLPAAAQTSAPIVGVVDHLAPYVRNRQLLWRYDGLPSGAEFLIVNLTRWPDLPSICSAPQHVVRRLPFTGKELRLSYAARCVMP